MARVRVKLGGGDDLVVDLKNMTVRSLVNGAGSIVEIAGHPSKVPGFKTFKTFKDDARAIRSEADKSIAVIMRGLPEEVHIGKHDMPTNFVCKREPNAHIEKVAKGRRRLTPIGQPVEMVFRE